MDHTVLVFSLSSQPNNVHKLTVFLVRSKFQSMGPKSKTQNLVEVGERRWLWVRNIQFQKLDQGGKLGGWEEYLGRLEPKSMFE